MYFSSFLIKIEATKLMWHIREKEKLGYLQSWVHLQRLQEIKEDLEEWLTSPVLRE